jgi:hypothetical protein
MEEHEPRMSKYGFTYTSREDRAQKLTNLHRLRHGKGRGQPSIHYGDDNNKWKKIKKDSIRYNNQKPNKINTRINKS